MLAIAKTQCKTPRTWPRSRGRTPLNAETQSANYNQSAATTNAQNILTYNVILGSRFNRRNCSSPTAPTTTTRPRRRSTPISRRPAASPYTAVSATVTSNNLPGAFSTIFGTQFLPNVSATAQAVHRPRDIALVMDLSGSMRMGTCLGFDFYTTSRTTNNPDTARPDVRPLFVEQRRPAGTSTNQTSS